MGDAFLKRITYHGRRAGTIENETIRLTVLAGGGHVAEALHKPSGVNPLWLPPWPSIEPSSYRREKHPQYGPSDEALVLSGIMGHSICLDTYGSPSPEEFAAGVPVHGEGPVVDYELQGNAAELSLTANLPLAQIWFQREIRLNPDGQTIHFRETLENLSCSDRPIAWMQHVTLGPPFVELGRTQFRASVTRSKTAGANFSGGKSAQMPDTEFVGLACPRKGGGTLDLRVYSAEAPSAGFTTHLNDPKREDAFFAAWSPASKVLFGYVWKCRDFPWLCRWEENQMRADAPWHGKAMTCGMEFGVAPVLGSRRELAVLGSLWDTPAYIWLPAKSKIVAEYFAFLREAESIPENVREAAGQLIFD